MRKMKKTGGFSLVELIVVIVIMLVLGATIVPNATRYITRAQEANSKNNASAILTQVQLDVADVVTRMALGEQADFPKSILGNDNVQYYGTDDGAALDDFITDANSTVLSDKVVILIRVENNEVTGLSYADEAHKFVWSSTSLNGQSIGWKQII